MTTPDEPQQDTPATDEAQQNPPATTEAPMQLAGMALRNGVLVIGPTHWAAAVREPGGEIRSHVEARPSGGEALSARVPLLRGPVRLANMLRVLPQLRSVMPDARLAVESRAMVGSMVLGAVASGLVRKRLGQGAAAELATGTLSLALTIASMRDGEIAQYHGAEHKAIGGYEQGIEAADAPREHPRCGTQLAIPMLVLGAVGTQLAMAAAPRHPRTARLTGQLIGVGAATELFRAAQRGRGTAVAALAARTGRTLQTYATTAEPDRDQLDVAEAALTTLLAAEAQAAAPSPAPTPGTRAAT